MLTACVFLSVDAFADGEPFDLILTDVSESGSKFEAEIEGLITEGTEFKVKKGVHVTIKATPADGYVFKNWEFDNPPEGVTDESLLKPELIPLPWKPTTTVWAISDL